MNPNDNTDITEIRVFQSLWKTILLAILVIIFAAAGCLVSQDANTDLPTRIFIGSGSFIFLCCGLLSVIMLAYNRIHNCPILIIYEDRLDSYEQFKRTYRTIHFADVKRFRLTRVYSTKIIVIDYKTEPLKQKLEESSFFIRFMMRFSSCVSGGIEGISCNNLTMSGKALCDLLNRRLKNAEAAGLSHKSKISQQ